MIIDRSRGAVALLALTLAAAPAGAADVVSTCASDLATYCSAVEPGHGRLMACLYAHETTLSVACSAAIIDQADMLDAMFEQVRMVKQECGADLAQHCGDVPAGDGRILSCLVENKASLSGGCAGFLDHVSALLKVE